MRTPTADAINAIKIVLLVLGIFQVVCGFCGVCVTVSLGFLNCIFTLVAREEQTVPNIALLIIRVVVVPLFMLINFVSPIAMIVIGSILPGGNINELGLTAIIIGSVQLGLQLVITALSICFCVCSFCVLMGIGVSKLAHDADDLHGYSGHADSH